MPSLSGDWIAGAARSQTWSSPLKELAELGIGFVPLTEAFDITTPTGRALAGMLLCFRRVRAGDSALLALLELARSRAVLLAQFRPFTPILLQRVDT